MATATAERKRTKRGGSGTTLDVATLKQALAAVKPAVPGHTPKPILHNVLFDGGTVTATDLEIQVSAGIDANVGPLLLPFARLEAILKTASGDEVTLTPDGSKCTVVIGRGEWTLPTEDPREFPAWKPQSPHPVCRLPADQFCRAVKSVVYATDSESSRYALGGVMVEYERDGGKLSFVATDGRRLSLCTVGIGENQDPSDSQTLVTARAMAAIESIAKGKEDAVQIEATPTEVIATVGDAVVQARLMEGRYPRWRDVFPKRDVRVTTVDRNEFLAATRQAAIVTSEESKGVTFAFTDDGIHLTARSSQAGESSVTCPHLEFGQQATVQMDPRYVADWLRNLDDGEPVEIEAAGPGDAVVFRCGDCRGVVMPLARE